MTKKQRVRDEESGSVAVTFGLTTAVSLLIVGGSLDIGRAYSIRSAMQQFSDATALVSVTSERTDATNVVTSSKSVLLSRLERYGVSKVELKGRWLNQTDFEITATSKLPTSFLAAVPIANLTTLNISTRTVARSHRMTVIAGPPTKIDLSYEAADYNQVWAYCYNPNWEANGTRKSDEGTGHENYTGDLSFVKSIASNENRNGRSDFVLIADNGGSDITLSMPKCKNGEHVSYMLFNSRNNRTSPHKWKNNHMSCGTSLSQNGKTCYTWYTDAKPDANGAEQHDGTSPYQLETVLCDDAQCNQPIDGGKIPENNKRNRIPQVAKSCEPGKYMYFGWEDRPPQNKGGNGKGAPTAEGMNDPGGDRDYDDIRLIVSCPHYEMEALEVRIIE